MEINNVRLTMTDHGCLIFFITVEGYCMDINIGGYCIGHGYFEANEFKSKNGKGLVAIFNIILLENKKKG